MVRALLKGAASVNAADARGQTPLLASVRGNPRVSERLLYAGADIHDARVLCLAAQSGLHPLALQLLDRGVDPRARCPTTGRAPHELAAAASPPLAALLLRRVRLKEAAGFLVWQTRRPVIDERYRLVSGLQRHVVAFLV
ncbi:hypothetical protein DIPPA_11122 [Diplonema papillatum]|nr:hypothetical protein DIPPA_11122 [Diplonema papillatum]